MFKKTLALCVLVSLTACSEAPEGKADASAKQQTSATQAVHKNALYLPDGNALEVVGQLRSYTRIDEENGHLERYVFESSENLMSVEGAVYAALAKRGYVRKVRKEQAGLYVVSYMKKGSPSVTMSYEEVKPDTVPKVKTRLKVTWKNA
ncbi:hypothetical protein [Pseudomonas sp. Irchel 3E20]|uniref:hypothetical protein n=1 Tax=Pseudomonas sp. Irchel 3E20 TaxID=2008983 RepID=UPI000BA39100|nr:hypothetical protein [Pseudomonas sp. Irchel 3E20]